MLKRILSTGALLALLFNLAGADVPGLINFQGILTDASAVPLADDTNSVLFTIYDAVAGGNPKWSETQSVVTDGQGRFSVLLGEVNAIEDTVFKQPERWLEIKIGSDPVMIPRTRLASVPYSFLSDSTQAAGGASGWVDDGAVVRLANSGDNVGIGTNSPLLRLGVNGSIALDDQLVFYEPSNGNGVINWGTFGAGRLFFRTLSIPGDTLSYTERMVITYDGNVGIGTTSPQGALDVSSTTGAFIVPRMTTAQRNALTAVNGMIIYNTSDNQFNFYEAGAWVTK